MLQCMSVRYCRVDEIEALEDEESQEEDERKTSLAQSDKGMQAVQLVNTSWKL